MKFKKILLAVTAVAAALTLAACSSSGSSSKHTYTVGVAGNSDQQIWEQVAKDVKSDGITLKVKMFSDYTLENPSVQDGSLDLNAFQHQAFLNNWNQENHGDLVSIGTTYISPFGLYSKKIKSYKDLKDGDTVAIPNDPTNGGRALQLLAAIGDITLKKDAPSSPQLKDIEKYNKKITIKELQADQIVAALPDVTAACINTDYVVDQMKTTPAKSALYIDTDHPDQVNSIYKNLIAVKKSNKDNADFAKIVKAYQTDKIAAMIKTTGNIPAFGK